MRLNQQGTKQMVTEEQKAAAKPLVEQGVAIFADREKSAKADAATAKDLDEVLDGLRDAKIISAFECHAYKVENRQIDDAHQAALMVFHHKLTRRCVELGIDVPDSTNPDIPKPMDGGGHR